MAVDICKGKINLIDKEEKKYVNILPESKPDPIFQLLQKVIAIFDI